MKKSGLKAHVAAFESGSSTGLMLLSDKDLEVPLERDIFTEYIQCIVTVSPLEKKRQGKIIVRQFSLFYLIGLYCT